MASWYTLLATWRRVSVQTLPRSAFSGFGRSELPNARQFYLLIYRDTVLLDEKVTSTNSFLFVVIDLCPDYDWIFAIWLFGIVKQSTHCAFTVTSRLLLLSVWFHTRGFALFLFSLFIYLLFKSWNPLSNPCKVKDFSFGLNRQRDQAPFMELDRYLLHGCLSDWPKFK